MDDDSIRNLLAAAAEELELPSDSELSDIGSDDDMDGGSELSGAEQNDILEVLRDTVRGKVSSDLEEDPGSLLTTEKTIPINLEEIVKGSKNNQQVFLPGKTYLLDLRDANKNNTVNESVKGPHKAAGPSTSSLKDIAVRPSVQQKGAGRPPKVKKVVGITKPTPTPKPNNGKKPNPKPNPQKNKNKKPAKSRWFPGRENKFSNDQPIFLGNSQVNIDGENPTDFFCKIFPDSIFELIVEETIRYAIQKGKVNFNLTVEDLKAYFGINIMMTYIKYPQSRMYWSSITGLRMDLIANCMSVNRFEEIKRYFHLVNNEDKDVLKGDKFWKIRPLISKLHDTFHSSKTAEEHQSIDEMIVPFKGRSSLKQYIKNKPTKWGFKIWVRSAASGYVNCFEMYTGKSEGPRTQFGPVGDTVLRLCHDINGQNHKLFMDNLFIALPLVRTLQSKGIFVLGTVRLDRVPKEATEHLVQPQLLNRGHCSIVTSDDNVTLVRWMDTRPVHTLSTYAGAIPEDEAKRWDRKLKKTIFVSRPYCIKEYNKFMGGVDLIDRMVAHYPHGFKNKKWYLRIVFHLLNVAIVNAWHLFKIKTRQAKYPLLSFKAALATTYMLPPTLNRKRGRPSTDENGGRVPKKRQAPSKMIPEVRFDGVGHYPKKVETTAAPRCHDKLCNSRTRFICRKCEEPVCPDCMERFHSK